PPAASWHSAISRSRSPPQLQTSRKISAHNTWSVSRLPDAVRYSTGGFPSKWRAGFALCAYAPDIAALHLRCQIRTKGKERDESLSHITGHDGDCRCARRMRDVQGRRSQARRSPGAAEQE